MALKDIQINEKGTAGNRQHATLTILHKP